MTQQELIKIATITIGIGIVLGTFIVLLIQVQRQKLVINSLVSLEQLIGLSGIVEIPFDQNSKGKIRVNAKGSLVDIVALSNVSHHFKVGEEVLIIEAHENKVRVIPMSYLTDELLNNS
ncbi:hypothetical protein C7H19_18465 [Aphanothece hegewaldii CCALA 016]|uniref:NfeD-like C-terminal domain-containing protein n=1 Tax=Aphanothece hegewaldii CCALA 016 TaxID=2107694 RepID=A0A2T1LTX0_9CHRO|nr:hypothetical protein [Aphanothece hegewaldii]PSF34551.1 hypothetical protein C7H19_18465 [Aphanothece hegewaldii CCALA 016]